MTLKHVISNLRNTYKKSMMKRALADRILLSIYDLRNMHIISYFVIGLVFGILVSSYFSRLLVWLGSLSPYCVPFMILFVSNSGVPPSFSPVKADSIEALGGEGRRVAYYLRVSSSKQAKYGRSIEAQKDYIDEIKLKEKPSLVYGYVDNGKSGIKIDDRKIIEILHLAINGRIDELWLAYIDRMGRNMIEMLYFVVMLWRKNVYIRTPEMLYTNYDLKAIILIVIELYMAEESNKKRIARVRDSKIKNFVDKKWNKSVVPLGYIKNNSKWLTLVEEWKPIIRDICMHFLNGESYARICKRVNKKYKEIIHGSISSARIKSIVSDPIYIGKPKHLDEVVEDPSLRMVSDDIYNKAQEKLDKLERKRRKSREKDPLLFLVDIYSISVLDFLNDKVSFRHNSCGGELVKYGPRLIEEIYRQTFHCKRCGMQFWVPNQSQMKKIREYYEEKTRTVNPLKNLKIQKKDQKTSKKKEKKPENTNLDNFFNIL